MAKKNTNQSSKSLDNEPKKKNQKVNDKLVDMLTEKTQPESKKSNSVPSQKDVKKAVAKEVKKVRSDFNKKMTILVICCLVVVTACLIAVISSQYLNYFKAEDDNLISNANPTNESDLKTEDGEFIISPSPTPSSSAKEEVTPSPSPTPTPSATKIPEPSPTPTVSKTPEPEQVVIQKNVTKGEIVSAARNFKGTNLTGWEFVQKTLRNSGFSQVTAKSAYGVNDYAGSSETFSKIVPYAKIGAQVSWENRRSGDVVEFGKNNSPISSEWMGIVSGDNDVIFSLNGTVQEMNPPAFLLTREGGVRVYRLP